MSRRKVNKTMMDAGPVSIRWPCGAKTDTTRPLYVGERYQMTHPMGERCLGCQKAQELKGKMIITLCTGVVERRDNSAHSKD